MADDAHDVFDGAPADEKPRAINAPQEPAKEPAKPETTDKDTPAKDKDRGQEPGGSHTALIVTLAATAVLVVACLLWTWSPLAALVFLAACALAGVALLVGGVARRTNRRRSDNATGSGNGGRATGTKAAGHAGGPASDRAQRRRPNPLTKAGREARRKAAQDNAGHRTPGTDTRKPRSLKDRVTHPFRKDRQSTKDNSGSKSTRPTSGPAKPTATKGATPTAPKGTKPRKSKPTKPYRTAALVNPGAEPLRGRDKGDRKYTEPKNVADPISPAKPKDRNKRATEGANFHPQADKRGRQTPKSDNGTNTPDRPAGDSKRAREGAAFAPKDITRGRTAPTLERAAGNVWRIHAPHGNAKPVAPVPNLLKRRDTGTNNSGGHAMNTNVDALTKQLNTVNYGTAASEQRAAAAKHDQMAVDARSALQMLGDDPGSEESRNAMLKQADAADRSAESRKRKAGILDQLSQNGFKF